MKILLLGATGRTGRYVLETLLQEGYAVHALVRPGSKIEANSNGLTVFEGDPTDPETLRKAISGCDAVISALNISRTSDFPWAGLRTPETLLSDTVKNILKITNEFPVRRMIICSAWGVRETKNDLPAWFRWLIDHSNIGAAYRDHERQEDLLRNSALDFTIVRPVGLTNSRKDKEIKVHPDNSEKPKLQISRKSVAKFMVKQLTDYTYSGKAITLSEK